MHVLIDFGWREVLTSQHMSVHFENEVLRAEFEDSETEQATDVSNANLSECVSQRDFQLDFTSFNFHPYHWTSLNPLKNKTLTYHSRWGKQIRSTQTENEIKKTADCSNLQRDIALKRWKANTKLAYRKYVNAWILLF